MGWVEWKVWLGLNGPVEDSAMADLGWWRVWWLKWKWIWRGLMDDSLGLDYDRRVKWLNLLVLMVCWWDLVAGSLDLRFWWLFVGGDGVDPGFWMRKSKGTKKKKKIERNTCHWPRFKLRSLEVVKISKRTWGEELWGELKSFCFQYYSSLRKEDNTRYFL